MSHETESRARAIEQAKSLPFLDAVFVIVRFNESTRHSNGVEKIHSNHIWEVVDEILYPDAIKRASEMYARRYEVGRAFHETRGTSQFSSVKEELTRLHPGFGDSSYDAVIEDGAIAER